MIKKKYVIVKEQLNKIKKDNNFERKELENLRNQNQGYTKIIERLEKEMKISIEEYEKDIERQAENFKIRL